MSYRITLTELDGTEHVLEAIHRVEYTLNHSRLHTGNLVFKDPAFDVIDAAAFADIEVELDGSTQLVGEATAPEEDKPQPGLDWLKVFGPGYALTRTAPSGAVTYEWEARWLAIQDYLNNQVGGNVDATVYEPTTEIKSDDTQLAGYQDATLGNSFEDFYTPADDEPVIVTVTEIRTGQSSYTGTEDDFGGAYQVVASDNEYPGEWYIDGEAADLDPAGDVTYTFSPEYDIPADRVGIKYHLVNPNVGNDTQVGEITITFNGNDLGSLVMSSGWVDKGSDYTGGDLKAGNNYTFQYEYASSSTAESRVDAVNIYDTKYPPTVWDEAEDGNFAGTVDGPEYYPVDIEILPRTFSRPWRITDARIDAVFDDVSNGQQLELSNTNGDQAYLGATNTQSIDVDFDANDLYGDVLQPRITLSGYGGSGWLTTRANPQVISELSVYATTDSLSTIRSQELSDNDFQNLKTLHEAAWRFVIDPRERDPVVLESFVDGNNGSSRSADWRALDGGARRKRDVRGYANEVSLTYDQPDGTQSTFTTRDFDEVSRLEGTVIPRQEISTKTLTNDEVRVKVRDRLLEYTSIDQITGSIDAWPELVLPGYTYTVAEWDGIESSIERNRYSETGSQPQMTLEFSRPTDPVSKTVDNRTEIEQVKRNT
jgi:hypothetical protein